jgi:hypothetical protein
MPLTDDERKVAAARAENYPPGFGHYYIARNVTEDEEAQLTDVDRSFPHSLAEAPGASIWLLLHPEDVEKG